MVCEACLRENDPFAKYCCDCGRSLTGQAAQGPEALGVWSDRPRRCASCGETILPRSRFCSECGSAPTVATRSNWRPGMILGLVVVGVLIIAAFAAIVIPRYFS
jgi:hypothetical protein